MQAVIDILANIGFDWRVALANLFNFIVIFILLDKFVFGVVRKSLKKRKETIEKGVEDAQKADSALVMAEEEKKGILKEAQFQANSITADAYKKAKETVGLSVKEASERAEMVIVEAEKNIERKKNDQEKELQEKTVSMVVSGVEKILKEEMTPELQERMIKSISK
jgi:F-type H+-transporting ATPase subunit b